MMRAEKLLIVATVELSSPLIWAFLKVIILEPLGVLDIHVSRVPEGPNDCVKISEEWCRFCWGRRDP